MKSIFLCAFLIFGINCMPSLKYHPAIRNSILSLNKNAPAIRNLVTDMVSAIIENFSQRLKDNDMDPLNIEVIEFNYALPVPLIFSANAFVRNVQIEGISDIVINSINFSYLTQRLTFNISLPKVIIDLGNGGVDVVVFGAKNSVTSNGRLILIEPRVIGNVRINLGAIAGGSLVRDLALEVDIDEIQSDLSSQFNDRDVTNLVNNFVENNIPTTIKESKEELSAIIEYFVWRILEDM